MCATAEPLVLIEPLKETRDNLALAVIRFTKGQLSQEDFWAECDWAATNLERGGVAEGPRWVWERHAELTAG